MRLQQYINESNGGMESLEYILNMLYSECYPYLKELLRGGYTGLLYSGRNGYDDYFRKKVRKDRYPKDMPYDISERIDDALYDEYGVYPRSGSLFCTGSYSEAHDYGDSVYSIYPIGNKYKYIWSASYRDLYSDWYDGGDVMIYDDVLYAIQNNELSRDHQAEYDEMIYEIAGEHYFNLSPEEQDEQDRDDWIEDNIEGFEDQAESEMRSYLEDQNQEQIDALIQTYHDDNLRKAIKSNNEIMLITKEVIGIHEDYKDYLVMYFKKHGIKKPTLDRMHITYDKAYPPREFTIYEQN